MVCRGAGSGRFEPTRSDGVLSASPARAGLRGPPGPPESPDPAPLRTTFAWLKHAQNTDIRRCLRRDARSGGTPRPHCQRYWNWLEEQPDERLAHKRAEADALFHRVGITFAVYGENAGTERLIPFDIVPRIIPVEEWRALEAGLKQRVRALNAFIRDVYHEQEILKAGKIPVEQVLTNAQYRPEMQAIDLPSGIYAHIAGIDVVRDGKGQFCVLEDNLRVPSGVSYMLENRKMMARLFPELFARHPVEPVEQYPGHSSGEPEERERRRARPIRPSFC